MKEFLAFARSHERDIIALIRRLVECESPSTSPAAVNRFVELVADEVSGVARVRTIAAAGHGKHLRCDFALPGRKKEGQILALGHSDTVWDLGTLRRMPFRKAEGRLWGPGVLDMKAGIAFFLFAVRTLRELGTPGSHRVLLQLNSDEEVGSPSSRALTEEAARASNAVLVLEPGSGIEGKLKTARKGVGLYTLAVQGRAAHAGVDFASGASAIVELARQIERVAAFTNVQRGITVNPGVISGGTRSNVIASEARAEVDIRIARARDSTALDRKFHALKPFDSRCTLTVRGGLNRPPMERSPAIAKLFTKARQLGNEIDLDLEESSTGGGSDGNFTAALGIPTLDGLGAAGEGAHAPHESVLIDSIAPRTALLAGLLASL